MTRHFYKHLGTGLVAPLNDSFAAVFGDRLERVGTPDEAAENKTEAAPKTSAKTEDTAPKEGDK